MPDIGKSLCAVVDFEQSDAALQAVRCLKEKLMESGMRLALLGPRVRRTLYKQDRADGDTNSTRSDGACSCENKKEGEGGELFCELHGGVKTNSELSSNSNKSHEEVTTECSANSDRNTSKASSHECGEEECQLHKQEEREDEEKIRPIIASLPVGPTDAELKACVDKKQQCQVDNSTCATVNQRKTIEAYPTSQADSTPSDDENTIKEAGPNPSIDCVDASFDSGTSCPTLNLDKNVVVPTIISEVVKIKSKVSIILREPKCPPSSMNLVEKGFSARRKKED